LWAAAVTGTLGVALWLGTEEGPTGVLVGLTGVVLLRWVVGVLGGVVGGTGTELLLNETVMLDGGGGGGSVGVV
jgi:hypothetical protein